MSVSVSVCVCVSVFCFRRPGSAKRRRRHTQSVVLSIGRRGWASLGFFFVSLSVCGARTADSQHAETRAPASTCGYDDDERFAVSLLFCFFFNAGRRIRHDDAGVVNATPPPPPRESFPFFFRPLFVQRGELLFQFCIFFGGGGLLWLGSGRVPERGRIRENGAPKRTPKFVAISMNQPNTKEIDDCIVDVVYRLSGVDIEPHIDILGRYIECRNTDRGVTS